MKTFQEFLVERYEKPLDLSTREKAFPQPELRTFIDKHKGIFYIQLPWPDIGYEPKLDAGEYWIRTKPVELEGDTLKAMDLGIGHDAQSLSDLRPVKLHYKYFINNY